MKVFAIAGRLLRSNLEHPQMLLIMLIFPLFFTLVFGGLLAAQAGQTKYPVAVSFPSANAISSALDSLLSNNPRLEISKRSEEEARELVRERKVIAAIIVPQNYSEQVKTGGLVNYTLVREEENNIYLAAKQEIDRAFYQIHTAGYTASQIAASESTQWQQVFEATLSSWNNGGVALNKNVLSADGKAVPARTQANVGFTIMFLMMSLVTTTGVMLQERVDGTWRRLLASPVRRTQILGGYLVGYFVLGWIQFGILVIASRLLFNIYWGDPVGLGALISLFILCSISLALAMGSCVKTFQQQQAMATIFITATSMLGGVFWPLEVEPKTMQLLALGIPQYWATLGVNNLLTSGLDWSRLALPLEVLGGFTLVFFCLGAARTKFE